MFPRGVLVLNRSPVTIRHLGYSGLNRQLDLLHHFASQFQPRKVMRSLVAANFLAGAAEVVDTPLNRTASCQCALWSLRLFQLSPFWRWSCDGKSTRVFRPPSRTTAYRSCTVQPSQRRCTSGLAVPLAPFQSPLSTSPCAFLSGQGAQHTLPQAFRGQCIYLKTFL